MCIIAILTSGILAGIFVGYDAELFEMTKRGFAIYSISFVVMGLNIYASSFFTALGNGLISAILSFLRTLLFQLVCVLVLPLIFDLDGIWLAIVAAEGIALILSFTMLKVNKKRYGY